MHGPGQDGAADHHDVAFTLVSERSADLLANAPDVPQIEVAIGLTWRTYADKRQLGLPYGRGRIASGAQLSRLRGRGNDLADVGFDDGGLAVVDQINLGRHRIDPSHLMSVVGETSRGHSPHIT